MANDPSPYSNKALAAMDDAALVNLYWSLFDTRGILPRRFRAQIDKSPAARAERNRKANAARRIQQLAKTRQLNLKSGRVYESIFKRAADDAPAGRIEKNDTVYSRYHKKTGVLVKIEWSPKLGESMYMVQFESEKYPTACAREDLTLIKRGNDANAS